MITYRQSGPSSHRQTSDTQTEQEEANTNLCERRKVHIAESFLGQEVD